MRHDIREGLFLHTRKGAKKKVWHIYAYVDGAEINRSSKTEDLDEAIGLAETVWAEIQERKRRHLSIKCPTFEEFGEIYINKRTRRMPDGTKKRDIIRNTRKYLVAYVENMYGKGARFDQLEPDTFEDYLEWRQDQRDELLEDMAKDRRKKLKKLREKWKASTRIQKWTPDVEEYLKKHLPGGAGGIGEFVSATQINSEMGILKDIFKRAVKKKYLSRYDLPELDRAPSDDKVRPGFNEKEIQKIRAMAKSRFEEAKTKAGKDYLKKMGQDEDDFGGYALGKAKETAWTKDTIAWSRYRVMVGIDLLAATGLRPKSLCDMRRGHVVETPDGIDPRLYKGVNFTDRDVEVEKPAYALVAKTRKGKNGKLRTRHVVPEEWAWEIMDDLFSHIPEGERELLIGVQSRTLRDRIKEIIIAAGLEINVDGETRSAYDIRHYYITRQLNKGISISKVAANTLTSLSMIEIHYNKLSTLDSFDELAGRG